MTAARRLWCGLLCTQVFLLIAGGALSYLIPPWVVWASLGGVLLITTAMYVVMFAQLAAAVARSRVADATVGDWRLTGHTDQVIAGRLVLDVPEQAALFGYRLLIELDEQSGQAAVTGGDAIET